MPTEEVTLDPAEMETAARMAAVTSRAASFDRLVDSNLQLVKTVRAAILVVAACAVLSMSWAGYSTYAMRGTLLEVRVMLQAVLEAVTKGRS